MMKLNTTYYWICIFLCIPSLIKAQEKDCWEKADSLFLLGHYNMAQLEYERVFFVSSDNITRTKALIKKSVCYKQMNDFYLALQTLKRVNYAILPDSLQLTAHYETALNAYLCNEPDLAKNQLQIIQHSYPGYLNKTILFLNVLVLNARSDWEEARQAAYKLIEMEGLSLSSKDSMTRIIDLYYDHPPKIKSKKKASVMSMIIPGLGQIYSGYYAEGIFSMALHVSWGWITYETFYNKLWFTSYIAGFSILEKFYFGNQKRAKYLATQHNLRVRKKFDKKIKEVFTQN